MVAQWRLKTISEQLDLIQRAIDDGLHVVACKWPLDSLRRLIGDEHFDEPSPMDKLEVEINAATDGHEPEFRLTVGWYVGEDWVEATGKSSYVCDALGELAGDIETQAEKERQRQAAYEAKMAGEVA